MKLDKVNITESITKAKQVLEQDKTLSPSTHVIFSMLMMIIELLMARLGLNSANSSIPPSADPNRIKKTRIKSQRKTGGQPGHVGTTLSPVDDPDEVCTILVDPRTLPIGSNYKEIGFESRQVMDLIISRKVTEYRAQILQNEHGKKFTAAFPKHVTRPIQYGDELKAHAVYMSQFQLIPYARIEDYFRNEIGIPVSQGSLVNFNQQAYDLLGELKFDELIKKQLLNSLLIHADETSINVGGKRIWLHNASNALWTYLYPHAIRGTEAMDEINILPLFTGTLCHDGWASYYTYTTCLHTLCNAHHLRELINAGESNTNPQQWAYEMHELLITINNEVDGAGGVLNDTRATYYRKQYQELLKRAQIECPPPEIPLKKKKGRVKRSKERCLLERLLKYEDDVLRFMECDFVPFTNNQGERDQRMTKVQQKISGCFRSIEGAYIFCRIRSYLSTCQKHGISVTDALRTIFVDRKLPEAILPKPITASNIKNS